MKRINAEIEMDENRNVVYVHSQETGASLIRLNVTSQQFADLKRGQLLDINTRVQETA